MEQQNNTQNNQQNNQQNQMQKTNNMQNRPQQDRNRNKVQDRRPPQDKSFNQDRNRTDRNQAGDRGQTAFNGPRGQNDAAYNQKPREQRVPDRVKPENGQAVRNQQGQVFNQNQTAAPAQTNPANNGNQNRYPKNPVKNVVHPDPAARHIKPKRIETVEDIQADIERIDKDIQFEIKQIRAVKLGL